MRFDRLTAKLQEAVADAQSLAVVRDNTAIEPCHVLSALLDQQGGSVRPLLGQAGADLTVLRRELNQHLESLPRLKTPTGEVSVGQELNRVFNLADKLAQQRGDQFIASELMLLAMLDANVDAAKVLQKAGVQKARLTQVIDQPMPKRADRHCPSTPSTSPSAPPAASWIP